MQTLEIILRVLEVILGWPVIILIIFLIFKDAISNFLRRLVKAEAMGASVVASTPPKQQKEVKKVLPAKSESEIEQYIKDRPSFVIEQYKILMNGFIFERAFNNIYGTQIKLLEHLSNKGETGENYINLMSFYNEYLKRLGVPSYQMTDYLNYLKESRFIKYEGKDDELNVKITSYGIDFLSYIKKYYSLMYKSKAL